MARLMLSKKKGTKKPEKRRVRRINWRGLALLGGLLALALVAYFPIKYWNTLSVRDSALAQAKEAREKGDVELALRHLDRYLRDKPEDLPVLEARADLVVQGARSPDRVLDAANTLDLLIRLDPDGKDRASTRRKLAEMYISYSDYIKQISPLRRDDDDYERKMTRYPAAATIATQLVEDAKATGTKDGAAYRLLAMAQEGLASEVRGRSIVGGTGAAGSGSATTKGAAEKAREPELDPRDRAMDSYKAAVAIDPADLKSWGRLADLYMTWKKDPKGAERTLDEMLKANGNTGPVRMARYKSFLLLKQDDRARSELDSALALDPGSLENRVEAANSALARRDPAEARRQLDAIPVAAQEDLRVRVARGRLEFAEQHPDQAIDQWRRGLTLVGGGDLGLSWQLAFNLIQLNRLAEAEPLIKQYLRLSNGDRLKLGRFLEGLYQLNSGRVNEAAAIFEKIKELVPPNAQAEVLLNLARCYEAKGEEANAQATYRNAALKAPSSPSPRLALARLLQRRYPEEAIGELARALADSPDDPNLLLEMIQLRIRRQSALPVDQRRWAEVEDLIKRAEKIVPNNATLRNYRADYMAASGKLPEAVAMLGEAAKGLDRGRAESWIAYSQGLALMGRRDEALHAIDQGSSADNAGDRAKLRIAKARLLGGSGRGQAAREVLTRDLEKVPPQDLADLAQARGELLRELGDLEGSRIAYADWARLAPNSPRPGLALLDLAHIDGDEKAARLGLDALRALGGENQPYGIAARAYELLRVDPLHPTPPPLDRLDQADALVRFLRTEAPKLRIGSLLEGMVWEYRGNLDQAAKSYLTACNDDPISVALPRLIEAYLRMKRYDDLDSLRRKVEDDARNRQQPALTNEFDRIAALTSMKVGDKERGDFYASRVVENRPENVQARAAYARMLDANGKPDEALRTLQKLAEDRPNDSTAWLNLLALQVLRKTPADVARTIAQARRLYSAERPELFLAQCYWIGNDLANAKPAYKAAVEARPSDPVTLRSQAEFFENTNQGDLVEPALRRILELDPTSSWAARTLAMKLSERPEPATWAEAWSLVAPGSSTSGETPDDRLIRATVLARSPEESRRAQAIPAFLALANDLPVSNPLARETRTRLGQAMLDIGRFADAWEAIRPIADDPSRPTPAALVIAVEALSRSGHPDEAESRLERLAVQDPKTPQVLFSRAWIFKARGRAADASAAIESAYTGSLDGPNPEAVGLVASDLALKIADPDTALRIAQAVGSRWPKDAWVLARARVARKEYAEAVDASKVALDAGSPRPALQYATAAAVARRLDTALLDRVATLGDEARSKAPKDFNILVFLATIRHLQGRYDDELGFYREALKLSPMNVQFLNNMAWTLCEGLNKPDEALRQIDEAIKREGRAPQFLDTRGVILGRLGRLDLSIAELEQSAKADPSATTYYHLARACLQANKAAESRRYRELALKAKFDPEDLDPTDRGDLQKVMGSP